MVFTAPCFSECCGFCIKCCPHLQEEDKSSEPENLRRARDLSKFLGKNRIDMITMNYNTELKQWCKGNGYRNPNNIGITQKEIKKQLKNKDPVKYKLIQKNHDAICDNALCKAMYVNSTDWLHRSFYTCLPIYTRSDDKLQICGPCISREPSPPEISSF